jgi:hypothetical protein
LERRAEFPQFLNQGQPVRLLGRVISSSQGLYLYTNTKKHTHTYTNTKHPCPEWDSNPWSRLPSERAKTVHALDRSATVTGVKNIMPYTLVGIYGCLGGVFYTSLHARKVSCLCVRYEVLTAMSMSSVNPYSLVEFYQRFGGACRLHPHGRRVSCFHVRFEVLRSVSVNGAVVLGVTP